MFPKDLPGYIEVQVNDFPGKKAGVQSSSGVCVWSTC